jgi:aryl carrier-like protein
MTVDTPVPRITASARETHRAQLAELLDRDVAELTDAARLVDDLALDSLAMMTVLVWLGDQGLSIDADRGPAGLGPPGRHRGRARRGRAHPVRGRAAAGRTTAAHLVREARRAETPRLYQCDDLVRK